MLFATSRGLLDQGPVSVAPESQVCLWLASKSLVARSLSGEVNVSFAERTARRVYILLSRPGRRVQATRGLRFSRKRELRTAERFGTPSGCLFDERRRPPGDLKRAEDRACSFFSALHYVRLERLLAAP